MLKISLCQLEKVIQIAAALAEQLRHNFKTTVDQLTETERNVLTTYASGNFPEELTESQQTAQTVLVAMGYVYLFKENQQIIPIVPKELTEQLLTNGAKKDADNWFLTTKTAVETIYGRCELSHLIAAWNQHASQPVTMSEAAKLV
ncbi:hypothetical protein [Carnobacterium sp.]|uniref:hypothetical protein n=1 Tax=Carnobacterium sp. TaxID=48221 RepID=UPI0028AF046C|nr:hypothetical protein [Carnobacterium sp.]